MDAQSKVLANDADHTHAGANELTVEVFSPRFPESKKFVWPKSLEVGQAATQAAVAFGYEAGTPTLQAKDGRVLDRKKTLFEVGVRDFDQLELTDHGGGVTEACFPAQ